MGELIGEFPLYIPSVSVSSIGIGGGSIASVDDRGVLRVGPESAGSTPGPACYGRGGTEATVTDAMVVCGWVGHSEMAYGQLSMDVDLARAAVGRLADRLGQTAEKTAQAILDTAVSEMFVEVEKLASRSGVDLRNFTLMPFGGGGPMLGAFLAQELGMSKIMAPRRPGVVSALGGLVADLRGDFIRTVFSPLSVETLPQMRETFAELAHEGGKWLSDQGHSGAVDLRFSAEMRYAGQSYEIELPFDPEWLEGDDPTPVAVAFHALHETIYDFADHEGQVEIVNLRLSAIGTGPEVHFPVAEETFAQAEPERDGPVFVGNEMQQLPLFKREDLTAGCEFAGPAVVAQEDTTFAIPRGARVHVDPHLNLHLSFES